jgi:NAD(P) transhydrogenase
MKSKYDLIIIGSGPAGRNVAIPMTKSGKNVLVIENRPQLGGGCIHTGTIPSKTLREAALSLSNYHIKFFSDDSNNDKTIQFQEAIFRIKRVRQKEVEVIHHQLTRNNVDVVYGVASFIDKNTIKVVDENGDQSKYKSEFIVVATGSSPNRPAEIPFDDDIICDSDSILNVNQLPKSLIIAGAGVIGSEYACIFAQLGVKVHLINKHNEILNFVDKDIRQVLEDEMKSYGVIFHSNVLISKICKTDGNKVKIFLNNDVELEASKLLYCQGREGNTDQLNLSAAGIKQEKYKLISVNKDYQTSSKNIFACGDVIGYPSLASVSSQQGQTIAKHILNHKIINEPDLFPYGIYTVPEMSFIGKSEKELEEENIPFVVGQADYREIARGMIQGMVKGLLKLLVHKDTNKILGIHIVGYGASELIHIGQAVMVHEGNLYYFIDNVFNYPTLAEAYKVAALNAYNKLPANCKL